MNKSILITLFFLHPFFFFSQEIEKIEMYAINFKGISFAPLPESTIKKEGIFVRITNPYIIEESKIPNYINELKIDSINNDREFKDRDIKLILIVYHKRGKDTYYFSNPMWWGIIKNKKDFFEENKDLYKAVYSFFPRNYYWEIDND